MEGDVFEEIGVYITRRQNMVTQYIATRPILDLCEKCFGVQEIGFLRGGGSRRDSI